MRFQSAIETFGYGVALPATVSIAIFLIARQLLTANAASRYAAALALAGGFFAGSALFDSSSELLPSRHWHWLPWLGILAAVIGPIGCAGGISRPERWLLYVLLSFASAWLTVPAWSSLEPPRSILVPAVAVYLFLLSVLCDLLPPRVSGRAFLTAACVASAVAAATIAAFVSLTYGRLAGLAVVALAGLCGLSWVRRNEIEVRGLMPAYAILCGGCAFVGSVEPQPPLYGLLLMPAAPLGLWLASIRSLQQPRSWRTAAIQTIAIMVPLAAGLLWVSLAGQAIDGY